ncbi:unnamed protein product [Alopecurus aequalis]
MAEKEETRRLIGVVPATPCSYKPDSRAKAEAQKKASKTFCSVVGAASSEEGTRHLHEREQVLAFPVSLYLAGEKARRARRRTCNWLRLLPFAKPDPEPIRSYEAVKAQYDEFITRKMPLSQLRAMNHKTMLQCLEWYNSKHPDDEYEPAPCVLTRCTEYNKSIFWTHGNFVARRKRSGCLSFLPAPRTLFFFELLDRDGVDEVSTCTPIDEPVTEAYTFLGFPLGWGRRRHGGADCVCKTCYRQFYVPHRGLKRTMCACGDSKVESTCKMCYLDSDVLHPIRGGFAFGQESFFKIPLGGFGRPM